MVGTICSSHPEPWPPAAACFAQVLASSLRLLCGSFFMIKLFLSLARLSHAWSPLELWGTCATSAKAVCTPNACYLAWSY